MDTKANAYAVLRLCEGDPLYDNSSLDTDISHYIREHMGVTGWPTWRPLYEHIGFDDDQGRDLWHLLEQDDWGKGRVLRVFERMIKEVHGELRVLL